MNSIQKINASSYCDYNDAFALYDQNRQPNGLQEILSIFSQTGIPAEDQIILEGGFGTGAYINHMRHHVKAVYGVEGSEQGYAETKQKTKGSENVHLEIGNILDLSFADNFFDAYMVNQVLHHLDTNPYFPNLSLFLKEGLRVLKPGGVLTINTCSQKQLDPDSGVYWNYKYIEKAARTIRSRYIPVRDLISRLVESGFADVRTTIPSGRLFQEQYYRDPSLVLDTDFQKSDSICCLLTEEESSVSVALIQSSINDGSVYRQMERAAEQSKNIGEAVIISARKPM